MITFLLAIATAAGATQVPLNPGDDLQAIVDAHPAGTSYTFAAGLYRLAEITPKTGDVYVGVGGATVLTGARLLTAFGRDAATGLYVAANQTQHGQVHGECLPGHPRCAYPEDLFFDRVPLLHVNTTAAVANGTWYFDYAGQRILFADDPRGHVVETSVARHAFGNPSAVRPANVTVANLTATMYAIPAQMGAIGDQFPGNGWRVDGCTLALNHGAGAHLIGGTLSRSNASKNGQQGVSCGGADCLVEFNEIAYNNYAGFSRTLR